MHQHVVKYFSGQFVARGTVYLYSVLISKLLTKGDFVQFTLFLVAANIYSRICTYSLNMLITKIRFSNAEDPEAAQQELYSFMLLLAASMTVLATAINLLTPVSTLFGLSRELAQAVLLSGCFLSIENGSIEMFQSKFQSSTYLAYMFLFTGVLILFSGVSYFAVGFTYSLVPVCAYVAAQFGVLLLFRRFHFTRLADRARIKNYFIMGTPLFFYSVATYLNRYFDILILNKLDTPENIANFAFISRMTEVLSLVTLACGAVLSPLTFQVLKKKELTPSDRRTIGLLLTGQTAIFFAYYITVKGVTHYWFPEYQGSLAILPWLVFSMFLSLLGAWLQTFLLSFDSMTYMLFANVILAVLGFGLNVILIPKYSVMGAAAARNLVAVLIVVSYAWKAWAPDFGLGQFRMNWVVAGNALALGAGVFLF